MNFFENLSVKSSATNNYLPLSIQNPIKHWFEFCMLRI